MQEMLYQTLRDILESLKAVTGELHARHLEAELQEGGTTCRQESCLSLSRLEAQVEALRRSLGIAAFRPRGF